jgi:hypothetical protein
MKTWKYDEASESVESSNGIIICDVYGDDDEQLENGTLMAAAPELLKALKMASANMSDEVYDYPRIMKIIYAAIAKAEGIW